MRAHEERTGDFNALPSHVFKVAVKGVLGREDHLESTISLRNCHQDKTIYLCVATGKDRSVKETLNALLLLTRVLAPENLAEDESTPVPVSPPPSHAMPPPLPPPLEDQLMRERIEKANKDMQRAKAAEEPSADQVSTSSQPPRRKFIGNTLQQYSAASRAVLHAPAAVATALRKKKSSILSHPAFKRKISKAEISSPTPMSNSVSVQEREQEEDKEPWWVPDLERNNRTGSDADSNSAAHYGSPSPRAHGSAGELHMAQEEAITPQQEMPRPLRGDSLPQTPTRQAATPQQQLSLPRHDGSLQQTSARQAARQQQQMSLRRRDSSLPQNSAHQADLLQQEMSRPFREDWLAQGSARQAAMPQQEMFRPRREDSLPQTPAHQATMPQKQTSLPRREDSLPQTPTRNRKPSPSGARAARPTAGYWDPKVFGFGD